MFFVVVVVVLPRFSNTRVSFPQVMKFAIMAPWRQCEPVVNTKWKFLSPFKGIF